MVHNPEFQYSTRKYAHMNAHASKSGSTPSRCPLNALLFGAGSGTSTGDFGLAILRVGIGLYIAFGHGHAKMFAGGTLGPSEGFIQTTADLGFPAPVLFAWMAAFTEFLGGLALALGLFTRPAALGLVGTMVVAAFLEHKGDPWVGDPSKELAMLYMLPAIAFVFLGSGGYGIDAVLRKRLFCSR